MFNLDSVKKGLDFVKKNIETVVDRGVSSPALPADPSGGRNVFYSIRESPENISDFPDVRTDEFEESVFVMSASAGSATVGDIADHFPISSSHFPNKSFAFRFKIEDDFFGFVWVEGMPRDAMVPTFRGNIHVQVLVCQGSGRVVESRRSSAESAPPTVPIRRSGSPPKREELVKARLEREAAQIQAARDFAQANAQEEANRRQGKLDVQSQIGPELDKWALTEQGKFKDVRSLLSSMSTVLWSNSGWVDAPFGELMINETAVKKAYRKAIIMCHPDRHQQATAEQQYRADRIFNAINESFKVFNNS